MLIHRFCLVNKDDLVFDNFMFGLLNTDKILYEAKISDDFIQENHTVLLGDSAMFSTSFHAELHTRVINGLCYYGPTVLCGKDIDEFLSALDKISDCREKEILLEMSRSAIKKGCCIIHFGV